eukprot:1556161-Pleurochrysis_carterae.AAC.1
MPSESRRRQEGDGACAQAQTCVSSSEGASHKPPPKVVRAELAQEQERLQRAAAEAAERKETRLSN